ncbi:MAG: YraN family protein [Clostridia bacterium]|nr:YraN family protein [Clostridia bacterium]
MNKKAKGYSGEDLAVKYLKENGYFVIDKNVRVAGVEIDVLAKRDDFIVLCEVKTRESEQYGGGLEGVTKNQQRRYLMAGEYLSVKPEYQGYSFRFDVIEVLRDKINHVENAF